MAASKFYAVWQPLGGATEDAHTALVFAFLRHAPADAALAPWLNDVLDGDVTVGKLEIDAHWPDYDSAFGGTITQPEFSFRVACDGRPRLIVIENKIYEPHTLQQTRRELIDSARAYGTMDVTLLLIGVHGQCPYNLSEWADDIRASAATYGVADHTLDLRYSPWSLVAKH